MTGATGLIGSNVCRLLAESGARVRALVRSGSDPDRLASFGVEIAEGDLRDPREVLRAAEGTDAVVNSAAVLGGAAQQPDEQRDTNVTGASNVFDAGARLGTRVVTLSTTTFFEHEEPLTERSAVAASSSDDPYTVTKALAYSEAMRRAGEGQDVLVVVPGGTFGPSPNPRRAIGPTSFNRLVRAALTARISSYVRYPVPWVLAEDVARATVSALRGGQAGEKYLAFGAEDAMSTASFLNLACELAGVEHRVRDVTIDPSDPEALQLYGPSLVALSQRRFPVPWFDNARTREALSYDPLPLRQGLARTLSWLASEGLVR